MDRRHFLQLFPLGMTAGPMMIQGASESPLPMPVTNGDEAGLPGLAGQFGKGLPHLENGLIGPGPYRHLCEAIEAADYESMEKLALGGHRKLANPLGACAKNLDDIDPRSLPCEPPPSLSSEVLALELVELQWMARCRDLPFTDYADWPEAQGAMQELEVPSANALFRALTHDDSIGPYLSQFLLLDVPYGALSIAQRYQVNPAGTDYLTDSAEWLRNVRGFAPKSFPVFLPNPRHILTGRDLAEVVHRDFTFQHFVNAALILLGGNYSQSARRFPFAASNPYPESQTQAPFCTFAEPEVLDLISRASTLALQAVWFQKWAVHRFLRPEECAGRFELARTSGQPFPLHERYAKSEVSQQLLQEQRNLLLSQSYPEGCPLHPSYPSGHATIAGACSTILKACFQEEARVPRPAQAGPDGLMPLDAELRVGTELNKLAMNIAMGRNFAGIHWRCDAHGGLRLGEAAALAILGRLQERRVEPGGPRQLTTFDGERVTI